MENKLASVVAIAVLTTSMVGASIGVFAAPAQAGHSGSADSCEEQDELTVKAWNEDAEDNGVDGTYGCGGATASCAKDDDSKCSNDAGPVGFDDASPVCSGDADHVRCTAACCWSGGKGQIKTGSTAEDPMDRARDTTATFQVTSWTEIVSPDRAFTCIDGECLELEPDCVFLSPVSEDPLTCEVEL